MPIDAGLVSLKSREAFASPCFFARADAFCGHPRCSGAAALPLIRLRYPSTCSPFPARRTYGVFIARDGGEYPAWRAYGCIIARDAGECPAWRAHGGIIARNGGECPAWRVYGAFIARDGGEYPAWRAHGGIIARDASGVQRAGRVPPPKRGRGYNSGRVGRWMHSICFSRG